jgi:release factor glutamine methyltransferase
MEILSQDYAALIRDKYDGNNSRTNEIAEFVKRLAVGEPLAYVIGWIPFLGLKIYLGEPDTIRPLIPRPETEWWTEKLFAHLEEKFGADVEQPFRLIDLCAGSGAIGLAVLSAFPNVHVSFGEIEPSHADLIQKNILENQLDTSHAQILTSDLFKSFTNTRFDIIATNPPYIPTDRKLEESVSEFEPSCALYSDIDGLDLIRQIFVEAPSHLSTAGEIWMECDISNIEEAAEIARTCGAGSVSIHKDQYDRPRLLVANFSDTLNI